MRPSTPASLKINDPVRASRGGKDHNRFSRREIQALFCLAALMAGTSAPPDPLMGDRLRGAMPMPEIDKAQLPLPEGGKRL